MRIIRYVILNMLFFVISLLLISSHIGSYISPFFIPFVFAIFSMGINLYSCLFGIGIAFLLINPTVWGTIGFVNFALPLIGIYIYRENGSKELITFFSIIGILFSSLYLFLYNVSDSVSLALTIVNMILQLLFYYLYKLFLSAIVMRGPQTPLTIDEYMGLALFLIPIAVGLSGIVISDILVGRGIIAFCVMMVSYLKTSKETLIFAACMGIGNMFVCGAISPVSTFVLWGLGLIVFKRYGRFLSALLLLAIDLILGVYFENVYAYGLADFIVVVLSCLIYVIIPSKCLKRLKKHLSNDGVGISEKYILQQEELHLKRAMNRLAYLFESIHRGYSKMQMGTLSSNKAAEMIRDDIISSECRNCVKQSICYEGQTVAERVIGELVNKGLSKKSVTMVDVPQYLSTNCHRFAYILESVNRNVQQFNKYQQQQKQEDDGKIIASNQMLQISEILQRHATECLFGVRADSHIEKELVEEFLYNNIIVQECAIFEESHVFKRGIIVVKNRGYKKSVFLNIIDKFLGIKCKIVENKFASVPGWQVITIVKAPKYTYTYGIGRVSKEKVSGDCYSTLMLDHDKVLFSVCDGKGTGELARQLSQTSIELIENFYKAGYDSQVIMDNVNRIMSLKSGENFSALDVGVLDLNDASMDFIKRGGTPSVIKHQNEVCVIEGSSLPIGLWAESNGETQKRYLSSGDVVVFASDGVYDCFDDKEIFANEIGNITSDNMNIFASEVLTRALQRKHGNVVDDMTVIAIRIAINL